MSTRLVGMDELGVRALARALDVLGEQLELVHGRAAAVCAGVGWTLPTGTEVAGTAGWARTWAADLRRRLSLLLEPVGVVTGFAEARSVRGSLRYLRVLEVEEARALARTGERSLTTLQANLRRREALSTLRHEGPDAVRALQRAHVTQQAEAVLGGAGRLAGVARVAGRGVAALGVTTDLQELADPPHDGLRGRVDQAVATVSAAAGTAVLVHALVPAVAIGPAGWVAIGVISGGVAAYRAVSWTVDHWDDITTTATTVGERVGDAATAFDRVVETRLREGIDWAGETVAVAVDALGLRDR
ncbi:MAG TPA: hypothetical protein VHF25_17405 [Nitriliruptorales bacterium]|nr:hypothetical protein [Nitriliruptorales bacterium]